ncbi:protein of unknown function (plasmid) [Paraburkholderia dioscoreae]|uniref:Uncharacterized protein n=1 Tax=Paraburkholderia dioscoreae TaxID=2604047 RepID=A0A5Q4ZQU2_9BURK|nr:protein of unknown function [Paraburkholderia dioscoreae]
MIGRYAKPSDDRSVQLCPDESGGILDDVGVEVHRRTKAVTETREEVGTAVGHTTHHCGLNEECPQQAKYKTDHVFSACRCEFNR